MWQSRHQNSDGTAGLRPLLLPQVLSPRPRPVPNLVRRQPAGWGLIAAAVAGLRIQPLTRVVLMRT
jgi:hypothetical protein